MKNSTLISIQYFKRLLAYLFISVLFVIPSFGQTTHNVEVKSNVFIPADISINVGDKIVWTNTGGNHNVNGTFNAYPDNPDYFGNETGLAGWTFEHTFTIEGEYKYHCDPHLNFGMTGTISVSDVTSVENKFTNKLQLLPNPVIDVLKVGNSDSDFELLSIKIYSITGAIKYNESFEGQDHAYLDLDFLEPGYYMIKLESTSRIYNSKFVKK